MHFSELVMENVEKGYFDWNTARINLPIPSVTTLQSLSTCYTKVVPVGIVEQTLDIAEGGSGKGSQYILSFDGKLVAKGFKGKTYGDINLWGIEKPISVDCALKLLKRNITTAEDVCRNLKPKKIFHIVQSLHSLLNQISRQIKTLRSQIAGEHQLRLKIVRMVHNEGLDNKQKYSYRMQLSFLNEHSARCDSAIGRCLQLNRRILKILSHLRKNSSQKPVELHLQDNAHFLFPPEHLCAYFNLDLPENTDIIKQQLEKWFNVRKKAKVTGSTMYNALGLSSLGDLKQHHYQFLKKRSPPPFSDEVKKRMKYGQENEKNALAAVIGGLLPAFLPNCFSFLEVGPSFISVFREENFMEVSPDGLLRCMVREECTNRNMPEHSSPVPVEAKCIYPDQSKPVEPMYQIIQRYVPQTLVEMAIYKVLVLWLISFTEISTVFMKVSFKEALWVQMLKIAHDLHGGEKPKVLTKLHPDRKELKVAIQAFVKTNCTFVCEIPSYFGVGGILRESEILSPYSYCSLRIPNSLDLASTKRQLKTICVEAKPLFQDIHNTLCQEAQEVLVFMLSDHNRHHEEFVPYSLPLGYAMKGKHLSNNELRFLVDECRRKLKERGIPILCEVYDGQWQNLCMTNKDGNPLMKLKLVKNT